MNDTLIRKNQTGSIVDTESEKNRIEEGTLYLVATPIGNLSDLSPRAKKVLENVTFIAAEDTRNSAKMLSCFDIHTPLISYHEHNKHSRGEEIAAKLLSGQSCALITDAGTPAISDPGEDLVRLCAEKEIPVFSIPGCCAAITALSLSGLPTGKFVFEGFLPAQSSQKAERLSELKTETRTVIYYEAPHKLRDTLRAMRDILGGERKASFCRELTKRNEETLRMTLESAVAYFEQTEPRGEFVIVVAGCSREESRSECYWYNMTPEEHVGSILSAHPEMKRLDAVKQAAKERGVPRNEIYDAVMKSKGE